MPDHAVTLRKSSRIFESSERTISFFRRPQSKRRPEDAFHDPVIGGGRWPDAHAEVDLPLRRDVQVDGREDLLLLVVQAGDVRDAAVVGVVLDSAGDLLGESRS